MDGNVIALQTGRPAFINLCATLTDFAAIGLYHASVLRGILTADELLADMVDLKGDAVLALGDGWFGLRDPSSVALRTLSRLAAVTDDRVIPYDDVAKAIVKMVEWGPEGIAIKDRKLAAKRWAEYFEILPSRAAVAGLATWIGATDTGKGIDFSSAEYVIEPTAIEQAVLDAVEMQYDFSAPSSRLCREARKRLPKDCKQTVDYRSLKKIPFILKPEREYNRLIGFEPDVRLVNSVDNAGLVNMVKSADGLRVILEYLVSEENVEGNSFNVPVDIKHIVAGKYLNEATGTTIGLNIESKFAQKLTGIGAVIREAFPDYITGQKCFIKLDKVAETAVVELIGANDIDAAIEICSWVKAPTIADAA